MNVVAISTLTPQHRFVLAQLHSVLPLRRLIQPVWSPQPTSWRQYARLLYAPHRVIGRRLNSKYENWRGRRHYQAIGELLGPESQQDLPGLEPLCRSIYDFNSAENVAMIRELRPDVILTSGCPILKPEIFELARLATINIHWGIAPTYRGENTLFWPVYFGDYQNVGVTIHKIDAGIDTGPILAHGYAETTADDDENTLTVKAARVAARLLPDVLAKLQESDAAEGFVPAEKGTLYLGRHRSWRHDLAYAWRRRMRRRRQLAEPPRDEIYIGQPASSC